MGSVGVSREADLVYRYLSQGGAGTVRVIAQSLGMPVRQLRQSLEELSDLGAVIRRTLGGTARWTAAAPAVVEAEIERRHQEAYLARHWLHQHLAELSACGIRAESESARLLSSPTRARQRLAELVARERFEHLVLNPDPVTNIESVCAAAPIHGALIEHQVAIKEVGVPPEAGDATRAATAELLAAGAQFRTLPQVPTKILILDRATALVRVDPADPGRGLLEISDPDTIARLVELFYAQWHRARDYADPNADDMALSPRERSIIHLLLDGHTDTSAARELGLSPRTVAYSLRAMMDRFGVVNRLQLGVRLAAHMTGPGPHPGHPDRHATTTGDPEAPRPGTSG